MVSQGMTSPLFSVGNKNNNNNNNNNNKVKMVLLLDIMYEL